VILLVEDDELVRELLRAFLQSAGYEVIDASSAEEALRAVTDVAARVRLVVTDMALPGLDGAELVRRLASMSPGVKALYMSGNPAEHARGASTGLGGASLSKPFSRELLMTTVRTLLESPD
jgi:DNA-binding response OmpR family regulator